MICTDNNLIVCASDTSLVVFSKKDGTVQSELELSASILTMYAAYGYLTVGTDDKEVHLYSTPTCKHLASIQVLKRSSSLYVANYGGEVFVLVADKFAEVWAYPVSNKMSTRTFMLQHPTSSITQMRVVPTLGQMFTADQDEKIRVSYYPASHVIANYCLGHTSVVSSIDVVTVSSSTSSASNSTNSNAVAAVLVSGGGDGTIRSWDPKNGKLLQTIQFDSDTLNVVDDDAKSKKNTVVVSFVAASKTSRSVTFAVVGDVKSKIYVSSINDDGTMKINLSHELNGNVAGIIVSEESRHVVYADDKGQIAWYHSDETPFSAALDNWATKAPLLTTSKLSATAPRGERTRERAEEEAKDQRKRAKLNQ
jgi:WD40 repeat protein